MMRLKQWGAVLMGCAALLLTACTVVDLDENGNPITKEVSAVKSSTISPRSRSRNKPGNLE